MEEDDEEDIMDMDEEEQHIVRAINVFLIDCHADMHHRVSYSRAEDLRLPVNSRPAMVEGTYVDMAIDQVHNFCREQIKTNNLHYVGVVLFNVDTPIETDDMKKGTVQIIDLTKSNITCVDTLYKLITKKDITRSSNEPEGNHCNLHNALKQGQTMINGFQGTASNKFTKNIIVLTCNNDPIGSGNRRYKAECSRMLSDIKTNGITVQVVHVRGEEEMEDDDWWEPFYDELSKMFEADEEERTARRQMSFDKSMSHLEGGDKNTRGGLHMNWKISPTMTIPVKFYSLVQIVPKPKKHTRERQQLREVETTTTHTCARTGAALVDSDIYKAFQVGLNKKDRTIKEYVPFSDAQVIECKTAGAAPGMTLLGFAPRNLVVDPSKTLERSKFMRPDEKEAPGATQTFVALWQAMLDKDQVAVCKLQQKGRAAKTVAVMPQREVVADGVVCPDGFHVITLPWVDDVRAVKDNAPKRVPSPSEASVKAAERFIKTFQQTAEGYPTYNPKLYDNPDHAHFFAHMEATALNDGLHAVDQEKLLADQAGSNPKWKDYEHKARLVMSKRAHTLKKRVMKDLLEADEYVGVAESYEDAVEDILKSKKVNKEEDPVKKATREAKQAASIAKSQGVDWNGDPTKQSVDTLKGYCRDHKLKLSGTKAVLIARITEHRDTAGSSAGSHIKPKG
jgi:Ku70/Ku80 beta-barrel domain/SAP domain/Ku70/Ku80 N-terminal alpha/beta domain